MTPFMIVAALSINSDPAPSGVNRSVVQVPGLVAAQDPPTNSDKPVGVAAYIEPPPVGFNPAYPTGDDIQWHSTCPGLVPHPFQRLPKVDGVGPCDEKGGGRPAQRQPWVKDFLQPAHVPLPRFGPDGSPAPTDGLLIYEGMRLTVYPETGTYEVSLTATVPDMPVVLRMQLQFTRTMNPEPTFTLTLPPIHLDPRANRQPGGTDANTFHVHHRGYSPLFLYNNPLHKAEDVFVAGNPPVRVNCPWQCVRVGSARFGTGAPPPDDLRR